MKTSKLTKISITVLAVLLLVGAMAGISVMAADADGYDIKSVNIIHDDKSIVLIAVDLPSDTALTTAPDAQVDYTMDGVTKAAVFHSYQYIEKYGYYYPCYYTDGIAPVDMGEYISCVAYKSGAAADETKAKSMSLAEYLYIRLYRDDIINATTDDDLDRRGMYLALLEYGSFAQKVFHNNKAENEDDQRTLVTDLIYVYAGGSPVNGSEYVLLDKAAAVTLDPAATAPAEYKVASWQATAYAADGSVAKTEALTASSFTPEKTTVLSPVIERAWEDFEDGKTSNSIDNTGGGGTASIVTEDGNKFYRVAKPEGKSAQEYIYTPNAALTYTDSDCVVYEAKLRVDFDTSIQGSFFILYGRYNGFKKFSIQNEAAGSEELTISDWRDGVDTTLSGRIGVKVGEWFTFRVENYKDASNNLIARVYINGVYFGESTNAKTDMDVYPGSWNFNNVTISSNNNMFNCKLDIDDVYVGEGKMYGFDDVVNDFEHSTVASSGGKVGSSDATVTINNEGSTVEIAEEENGNKYLQYNISADAGWMEQVTFVPTYPKAAESEKFVFEIDLSISTNIATVLLNPFGTDKNGAEAAKTQVYFYGDGGKVKFNYGSNNSWGTWKATSVDIGDWFKVRLEYEGTDIKVFVNGDLIFETTNPDNKLATNITRVYLYTFSNSKGDTLRIDNVRAGFVE